MSKRLLLKMATILVLIGLLLVPLSMISSVIAERQSQRAAAEASVKESTSGPQRIAGPVLLIPYRTRHLEKQRVPTKQLVRLPDADPTAGHASPAPHQVAAATRTLQPATKAATAADAAAATDPGALYVTRTVIKIETKEVFTDHELAVLPESLRIDGQVETTTLHRGLYPVNTFAAKLRIAGSFAVAVGALAEDSNVTFGTPYIAVGVGDVRGIRKTPVLKWQTTDVTVEPGTGTATLADGVHAPLPNFDPKKTGNYTFSMPLDLIGASNLSFTPLGRSTRIALQADWPHPSFFGRFLPVSREITDDGFVSQWETTWLATNLRERFSRLHKNRRALLAEQDVGVAFIEPVDPYRRTERAVKYDLLFVLLTFSAFFLFEIVRQLRIHPMQYALVGCALATFYLLLIALSEHIHFAAAYTIASFACVGLIGFYLSYVLRHWRRGLGFSGLLAGLYGALYAILQSEDHALLLGAALVFGALAAVMALTRRLDWYAVGSPTIPAPPMVDAAA